MHPTFTHRINALSAAVAIIVALTVSFEAFAGENYSFKHIDSSQGLSSSNVKCIAEDSFGFMWFGTKNGLNRYDGVRMRLLDCYDEELGQGNNNIGALYEDENKQLWVGTDRGVYVYNPRTDRFTKSVAKDAATGTESENWVQAIVGDGNGNVWVLIPDQGVFHYRGTDHVDYYNITKEGDFKKTFPSNIYVSSKKNVWVCTTGSGFYRFNPEKHQFDNITQAGDISLLDKSFIAIAEDITGTLILATNDGHIYRYNTRTDQCSEMKFSKAGDVYLRSLGCFDGEIWVGTQHGLYILDTICGTERLLTSDPLNEFSLSDDIIYYIYRSKQGDAWLGTMFGGVEYMARNKFTFEYFGLSAGLNSRRVRGLAQDAEGRVWIGSEEQGLNLLNPATGRISYAKKRPVPSNNTILMVTSCEGEIVVSFNHLGLVKVKSDGSYTSIFNTSDASNGVYSYCKDSRGTEWVGLGYALYRRKAGAATFEHVEATGYDWIFTIAEAADGAIWLGTMGNGVWRHTPADGKFKQYTCDSTTPSGLRSNSISSIFCDSHGNVWLSTDRGGISRYNSDSDTFTTYDKENGLPDDVAYSMLEDKNGNLWFGTNNGLVKFNATTNAVTVFTTKDGLPTNQFNYGPALRASDGMFYFGSIDGVVAFMPETEEMQTLPDAIYFTRMDVLNEEMRPGEEGSPLEQNIIFTDHITLPYDRATFALNVASPNFGAVGGDIYSYKIEPQSDKWVTLTDNRISFTNLAQGEYHLTVRVQYHGKTAEKTIKITILPPWWLSGWAYFAYFLLVAAAAGCWFMWYRNRKEEQLRERQKLFAINKEKELYESKVNFFTEVAHEIRTPIALIDAPLEAIEEIGVSDSKVAHYLNVMRQNTRRLLNLTGQLLDFQKIDSGRMVLTSENVDIALLVTETLDRFEPAITVKHKQLLRNVTDDQIIVSTDKEAVTKILSNLLNNALKYATKNIEVTLTADDKCFVLRVQSDGKKITEADRRRIFEPFYQVDKSMSGENGVGIGLSLALSLAKMLGGVLSLEEDTGTDNVFALSMPIDKTLIKRNNKNAVVQSDYLIEEGSNQTKENAAGYTVLIVEDNDQMREFLADQVNLSFSIETACNGKEAFEKLKANHIDLIVTDVMMPEMNGYELCKAVKSDIDLSHIPVVFITAKNDLESKIKSLQLGAEAYIEKPFSVKYFRQLIRSLLDNRRREREAFSKKPFFNVDNMHVNKADEEFINRVVKIIEDNIGEDDFNVESMADKFCMSHSSLLRKIKTVFNLSPVELIRLIKLKKAAELIQEGKYRIGDICYMVGISSQSYFSKLFFKQFGITPKDFEKQCQKKQQASVPEQLK
ncbi:MAG: two-component regulator propeller domain-containing protein [Muribaculaceae bacterium]